MARRERPPSSHLELSEIALGRGDLGSAREELIRATEQHRAAKIGPKDDAAEFLRDLEAALLEAEREQQEAARRPVRRAPSEDEHRERESDEQPDALPGGKGALETAEADVLSDETFRSCPLRKTRHLIASAEEDWTPDRVLETHYRGRWRLHETRCRCAQFVYRKVTLS
ncbi:hypothetical protein T484DRAFT_1741911 [Baffinella frigidus]|nr:hypothetical protein T484DRAFT_1741911 [Cryptophyta sp. CCMP2293]